MSSFRKLRSIWMPLFIAAASVFLFFGVWPKLAQDLWADENYSHGLLVPFVIAFIIWRDRASLWGTRQAPNFPLGYLLVLLAVGVLFLGTAGAELFLQRISLVLFLGALTVYFFGKRLWFNLSVPFALVLLSIPLPQILFLKLAFPLQLLASQIAATGVRLLGIPTVKNGNILEVVPVGSAQVVALEVVEACSGIRSMITLAVLGLLLAYLTSNYGKRIKTSVAEVLCDPFTWRALLLMLSAVPIAVVTNSFRVAVTTVATYFYGTAAATSTLHEISGLAVFVLGFVSLAAVNGLLLRVLPAERRIEKAFSQLSGERLQKISQQRVLILFITILTSGVILSWFEGRKEVQISRQELSRFPIYLDGAVKIGDDARFSPAVEQVLGSTDYVMRDYRTATGAMVNVYIGYYGSQRTGKTYHSPQNCLPGSGWEISGGEQVEIANAHGGVFKANKYLVERGNYRGLMIYWFQGRGRLNASEYWDKAGTIIDSMLINRTDGAMVRLMLPLSEDAAISTGEAIALSSVVSTRLDAYVPN